MTARLHCEVPGCRRTKAKQSDDYREWLCSKHWPTIRKDRRRVLKRLHRQGKRTGWTNKMLIRELRLWRAIRREAIERALGI